MKAASSRNRHKHERTLFFFIQSICLLLEKIKFTSTYRLPTMRLFTLFSSSISITKSMCKMYWCAHNYLYVMYVYWNDWIRSGNEKVVKRLLPRSIWTVIKCLVWSSLSFLLLLQWINENVFFFIRWDTFRLWWTTMYTFWHIIVLL